MSYFSDGKLQGGGGGAAPIILTGEEGLILGDGSETTELVIVPLDIDTNSGLQSLLVEAAELTAGVIGDATNRLRFIRQHQIPILNPFGVDIAAADDFGSTKVISVPDTNFLILSVGVIGSAEKEPGFPNATGYTWGFGTAPASNATLSGDMINLISRTVAGSGSEFSLMKAHTITNAGGAALIYIPDTVDSIYLNIAATLASDARIKFSGTLNLHYIDLGNVGS